MSTKMLVRTFNGTIDDLRKLINELNPDIGIIFIQQTNTQSFDVTVQTLEQGRMLLNFNGLLFNNQRTRVSFEREPSRDDQLRFVLERIKFRYSNLRQRELDLSNLESKFAEFRFTLTEPFDVVLEKTISFVAAELPDLLALNLSHNGIRNGGFLAPMKSGLKCLTMLDLSYNRLESAKYFEAISGLPLIKICLNNNPIQDVALLFVIYYLWMNDLKQFFPYLMFLDNKNISNCQFGQTTIGNVQHGIAPSQYNTIQPFNFELFWKLHEFFIQYFDYFDKNIGMLANLYAENSLFDVVLQKNIRIFGINSRNHETVNSPNDLLKFIAKGRPQILNFFRGFESTKHRISEMCFDILQFGNNYIVNIMGVMTIKETQYQFCRTFVLVCSGTTITIQNEHLEIYDNARQFDVINTFSKFIKYIVHSYPVINEQKALFLLEKNDWQIQKTEKEICEELKILPVDIGTLNPTTTTDTNGIDESQMNENDIKTLIDLGMMRGEAVQLLFCFDNNLEMAADHFLSHRNIDDVDSKEVVLTEQDNVEIEKLMLLKCNREECLRVYLKSGKNCEIAANLLFEN
ncbi:hypothetical protein EIN_093860 [Entamoeba invadens IP1]|uniref:UBA domain-containing protein n=1 Tax=Entamoeba invadens IP1 TaxID=370355 RepID=A0A0A1U016_ENTIV|nr:hypothetical protein EIN_093860 [Entamoeba invadens IP1]ELP87219.1 hypothetical protein EIN_093860 [Entamoeba invadens IP1]|eukprot:XP_004253990.1 hypothetical protein EIN_093860 [Entamoeba invadens IP1]